MTNYTKYLLAFAVVGGIAGLIAFFGLSPFGKSVIQSITAGNVVGSTFNSAKIAAINLSPTNNATSTSILNTDASDRYILSNFANCSGATTTYAAVTGAGLTNMGWKIQAATTSTNAPVNLTGNTNLVMNDNLATGTVAAGLASDFGGIVAVASSSYMATTTIGVNSILGVAGNLAPAAYQFVWKAGSYLTFISNATSTAACTVGVYYIAS